MSTTTFRVSDEYRALATEQGMAGTHMGAVNVLCGLHDMLTQAVAAGTIGEHLILAIGAATRAEVLPLDIKYLSQATPDEFLAIYEWAQNVIDFLDSAPEGLADWLDETEQR